MAALLAHALGLVAFVRYVDVSGQGRNDPPGVPQVSWIDLERPELPAAPEPSVKPKPLPMKPRPAAAVRPRPKPVLAVAAEMPSPIGHDAVAPPDPDDEPSQPQESADLPQGPAADSATLAGAVPSPPSAPSFDADYLTNPAPEYPALSRQLHEQGRVLLRVHVTPAGLPDEVLLHQSSGYARLDQAALEVVRRWRFVPAKAAGANVAGWVVVPIRFSLRS